MFVSFGDTGGKLKPLKAPKKGDKDYDEVSSDSPAHQFFMHGHI
jgi:hypothetical protein